MQEQLPRSKYLFLPERMNIGQHLPITDKSQCNRMTGDKTLGRIVSRPAHA